MDQVTLRVSKQEQEIIDFAKTILGTKKANPAICHIINDWFEMRDILAKEIQRSNENIHAILYLEKRVESLLNRNVALCRQIEDLSHPI